MKQAPQFAYDKLEAAVSHLTNVNLGDIAEEDEEESESEEEESHAEEHTKSKTCTWEETPHLRPAGCI